MESGIKTVTMEGAAWVVSSIVSMTRSAFIKRATASANIWPGKSKETREAMAGQVYDIAKKMK